MIAGRIVAGLLLVAGTASAQAATCRQAPPVLARGVSVSGVDASDAWAKTTTEFLEDLHRIGFDHIRVPIAAEQLTDRFASPDTTNAILANVQAEVDRLIRIGFRVVVDMHGGAAFGDLTESDPAATEAALIQAWQKLAPILNGAPEGTVLAEIFNEPRLSPERWAQMQDSLVLALRPIMPKITFMLSSGGPQRVETQVASAPSSDSNVIWSVHYYDPMVFTHQGAAFMAGSPIADLAGIPFPLRGDDPGVQGKIDSLRLAGKTAAADYIAAAHDYIFDAGNIERDMAALGDWSAANGQPVIIGEFGVLRDHAPAADRNRWLATLSASAEAECIGWTHWDATEGFGLVDPQTREIDPATIRALMGGN